MTARKPRFLFTDAVALVACPHCGALAGAPCRAPHGRADRPHGARLRALYARPDFDIEAYTVPTEEAPACIPTMTR